MQPGDLVRAAPHVLQAHHVEGDPIGEVLEVTTAANDTDGKPLPSGYPACWVRFQTEDHPRWPFVNPCWWANSNLRLVQSSNVKTKMVHGQNRIEIETCQRTHAEEEEQPNSDYSAAKKALDNV